MGKKNNPQENEKKVITSIIGEINPTTNADGSKAKLENRIRAMATAKLGKYNLSQYKTLKENFLRHKEICAQLVALSEKHNVPCCYVIYFAVGKDAHKNPVFEKGYKSINIEKAEAIIDFTKAVQAYLGMKTPTDALFHAVTKFYEKGNTNIAIFKSMLATAPQPTEPVENNFAAYCKVLGI